MENNQELYIIATPIGDIREVSELTIKTFNELKCILCEDTRTTKKLLSQLNIDYSDKFFVSYHKYNEHEKLEYIVSLFNQYSKIGLVSDAGYPIINDPGYNLISLCYENHIKINVVNGPCAAIHALVISGIPSNTFMYLGFLDHSSNKRKKQLNNYKNLETTFIVYESVHRIYDTLKDIYEVFGDVLVAVCRELSKMYESVYRAPISELIANLEQIVLKGEFVIIIDNNTLKSNVTNNWKEDQILFDSNLKPKDKAKEIAAKYNLKSSEVYQYLINNNKH